MTPPGVLVAFVASTDLDRSAAFYLDVLGLTEISRSPFALVVDGGGAPLRITLVDHKAEAPYTVLGWDIVDLTATVADLRGRGIVFTIYPSMDQDDDGAWQAPDGTRIVWFNDPDGNVLSLHQP